MRPATHTPLFTPDALDLTPSEYRLIRRLVYHRSGIDLGDHKTHLVRARLGRIIRRRGFRSFRQYYRWVEEDRTGEALCELLDAISTNTTYMFREAAHFELLREILTDTIASGDFAAGEPVLRIWSAGCSSGEEPYSIAMVTDDVLRTHPGVGARILATDLSTRVLNRAKLGIYEPKQAEPVPREFQRRYLRPCQEDGEPRVQVVHELRRMVTFARFNLMTPRYPFRRPFDVIFCRNVMIYFDRPTQEQVVSRFTDALRPGGYLLIGHSESLNNIRHPLEYVRPTVYRRPRRH